MDGSKGVKRKWFLGGATVIMITIIKRGVIRPGRHINDHDDDDQLGDDHTWATPR